MITGTLKEDNGWLVLLVHKTVKYFADQFKVDKTTLQYIWNLEKMRSLFVYKKFRTSKIRGIAR